MGRSVSWETMQKLFSYELSLRNPWGLQKSKTAFSIAYSWPILIIGLESGLRETVYDKKRETGLEPATACLEGTLLHKYLVGVVMWLCKRL
jgi:hypothetical protein